MPRDRITALSDAAILYGAQRYFDGLHDNPAWSYRSQYQKDDDKALFLELLHNLCLYDRIVLDRRPITNEESASFSELGRFLETVNKSLKSPVFVWESLEVAYHDEQAKSGASAGSLPTAVQTKVCALIASYVGNKQTAKMAAVQVPWAYHQSFHKDYHAINRALRSVGVSDEWLPFTLFVWRAIWYGALARFQAKKKGQGAFSYVAAPRRMAALEAVLDARTLAKFRFPREAVRAIAWELPEVPETGFDFSYLDFTSPFDTSQLAEKVGRKSPKEALAFIAKYRASGDADNVRAQWAETILGGSRMCSVGTTIIQNMSNMTVYGNATQSIRAIPA
jgi:hypothetical protein